ncbi:MATE family efflux transporter [Ruminococcus flavefaciens]|uniref:MATE family efflux transporter n=1 Tax=Ruminococcus flavefaciens TaxID=1265 RepID=UPI0004B6A792|nr:MATE family efflux transporter [Ruminococcus flavefaciens]
MEQTANQFLGQEQVGKLMKKYAVPCIISLLVGALYNIVDQIFIANASYLGSYGNAANTVVFPLTVIALAIAVMIGDGCCAFVSLSLGKGEPVKARKSVGNSVLMTIVSSLLLCAVYLIFSDGIIAMFGGTVNEETFRHSKEYFFYISLGIPFYMFGQAMNPVIRADGNPKFAMISTLAGAVLNMILDPIFIFAFEWGMMGAAVATVIGQIVTAGLAVWYLCNMKLIKPAKPDFKPESIIIRKTLTLGLTSFLSQISLVAAMLAINNMIRKYGAMDAVFGQEQYAQIPMAVVGIVMKFFQIVISIVVGMAAGCIPIRKRCKRPKLLHLFYVYNVNFHKKVLTNSPKCAAQLIRYTHLIGGFTVQKYCNIVKSKLNTLIRSMEKNASAFVVNPKRDFVRKSELSFSKTMRFILGMGSQTLGKELMDFYDFDPKMVSVSAIVQRRSKILPAAFQYLFHKFNEIFSQTSFFSRIQTLRCGRF